VAVVVVEIVVLEPVAQAVVLLEEITLLLLPLLQLTLAVEAAVAAVGLLVVQELEALAAPALSSSRSTNKDIHAKQSLSILWN
jgi:hypothetical protein